MAEAILTDEQKALLDKLRRKLGQTSDSDHREEDLRLYQMLGEYSSENSAGKGAKKQSQKDGDLHALLRELKEYIRRNGTEGELYTDAIDLLQALAPEQVAEAKRGAEKTDEKKTREAEEAARLAKERAQEQAEWLGLPKPEDRDGNGIPDDMDAWLENREKKTEEKEKSGNIEADSKEAGLGGLLAEGVKKLTESENRRKLEPEEVSELLRGEAKPKHVRAEKNVAQKDTGLKKDDEVMNRNIAITPKKK
ncbi:MAG: hypothetical protein IKH46_04220 [Lachnospiraceae bacterium]|nr:hypothetical protein [Lachnospiraceae bacterium]